MLIEPTSDKSHLKTCDICGVKGYRIFANQHTRTGGRILKLCHECYRAWLEFYHRALRSEQYPDRISLDELINLIRDERQVKEK